MRFSAGRPVERPGMTSGMTTMPRVPHDLCAAHAGAGRIKLSPQQIISEGTDFRLLNELKRELKTWTPSVPRER